MLGVSVEDSAFNTDILVAINSAIMFLHQIGVGPTTPILIADHNTEWDALTTDPAIQAMAKNYIYLSVKLSFDPPGTSFAIESFKKLIDEHYWRIQVVADPYIPPVVPPEV
jgi:hypothetical protein